MSREQEIVRRHFYYALDELSGQWVRLLRVQEIDFEWSCLWHHFSHFGGSRSEPSARR